MFLPLFGRLLYFCSVVCGDFVRLFVIIMLGHLMEMAA